MHSACRSTEAYRILEWARGWSVVLDSEDSEEESNDEETEVEPHDEYDADEGEDEGECRASNRKHTLAVMTRYHWNWWVHRGYP